MRFKENTSLNYLNDFNNSLFEETDDREIWNNYETWFTAHVRG